MSVNGTAVAYMGRCKSPCCNKRPHDVWVWVTIRNLWLSAAHIPGVHNVIADSESKKI